jgi:hypothetical protein
VNLKGNQYYFSSILASFICTNEKLFPHFMYHVLSIPRYSTWWPKVRNTFVPQATWHLKKVNLKVNQYYFSSILESFICTNEKLFPHFMYHVLSVPRYSAWWPKVRNTFVPQATWHLKKINCHILSILIKLWKKKTLTKGTNQTLCLFNVARGIMNIYNFIVNHKNLAKVTRFSPTTSICK